MVDVSGGIVSRGIYRVNGTSSATCQLRSRRRIKRSVRRSAQARKKAGFTQESFAAQADVDRSYYGAIERGEFNLTVDTIQKIAAGLDMSASELFKRAKL